MASSHDCKYVEVSAGLNHNVDTLLVRSPQVNSRQACKPTASCKPSQGGDSQADPVKSPGGDKAGSESPGKQVKEKVL